VSVLSSGGIIANILEKAREGGVVEGTLLLAGTLIVVGVDTASNFLGGAEDTVVKTGLVGLEGGDAGMVSSGPLYV